MSATLYHIALVTHIIGLTMMAGTTFVDFVITKHFWKQFANDKLKAIAINQTVSKFPMLFGIGIMLLILSGITMMYLTNGAFGEQTWFRIKFGLVIAIIINGLAVGRRQAIKLKTLLFAETAAENREAAFSRVKTNINWFHISQITMFIVIFILSAFKFN